MLEVYIDPEIELIYFDTQMDVVACSPEVGGDSDPGSSEDGETDL